MGPLPGGDLLTFRKSSRIEYLDFTAQHDTLIGISTPYDKQPVQHWHWCEQLVILRLPRLSLDGGAFSGLCCSVACAARQIQTDSQRKEVSLCCSLPPRLLPTRRIPLCPGPQKAFILMMSPPAHICTVTLLEAIRLSSRKCILGYERLIFWKWS